MSIDGLIVGCISALALGAIIWALDRLGIVKVDWRRP